MERIMFGAVNAAGVAVDCISSAAAAAWPRSMVNGEVERLSGDGHEPGETCDYRFVVALEPEDAEAGLRAIRSAGFTVEDDATQGPGYVTVRSTLPLRAFRLSWALARLNRAVRSNGGFAEMLGPASGSVALGRLMDPAPGGELRTNP